MSPSHWTQLQDLEWAENVQEDRYLSDSGSIFKAPPHEIHELRVGKTDTK